MDANSVSLKKYPEPRLNINQHKDYKFISGLGNVRYQNLAANSASSTTATWSYLPPTKILISRQWFIRYQLVVTLGGTISGGATALINVGLEDAVRNFPLMNACSSAQVTLNNTQVQLLKGNEVAHALMRFKDPKDIEENLSSAFAYQDQYANYDDYNSLGSVRSALSEYGESERQHRGCSAAYTIVSNTSTAAVVKIDITEPLMVSPLSWGKDEGPAIPLLTTMNVQLVYDLTRVWSHATVGGSSITSVSAVIDVQSGADYNPYLMFQELTPDLSDPEIVPYEQDEKGQPVWYSLPYEQVLFQSQDVSGSVSAGADQTTNINVLQLSNTPQSILIYVAQKPQQKQTMTASTYFAVNSSDIAARIKSLSIAINGAANYLAEASEEQLWQMSVKNGLHCDFYGWKYGMGSYLLLQLGSDVPLPQGTVPGSVAPMNIQISNLTFTNQTAVAMEYTCYVLGINAGIINISKGQTQIQTAVITVHDAAMLKTLPYNFNPEPAYGAGFFGDLWKGIKSLGSHVYQAGKHVLPYIKPALAIARPLLGVGARGGGAHGGGARGGAKKKKGKLRMVRGGVKIQTDDDLEENVEAAEWST